MVFDLGNNRTVTIERPEEAVSVVQDLAAQTTTDRLAFRDAKLKMGWFLNVLRTEMMESHPTLAMDEFFEKCGINRRTAYHAMRVADQIADDRGRFSSHKYRELCRARRVKPVTRPDDLSLRQLEQQTGLRGPEGVEGVEDGDGAEGGEMHRGAHVHLSGGDTGEAGEMHRGAHENSLETSGILGAEAARVLRGAHLTTGGGGTGEAAEMHRGAHIVRRLFALADVVAVWARDGGGEESGGGLDRVLVGLEGVELEVARLVGVV